MRRYFSPFLAVVICASLFVTPVGTETSGKAMEISEKNKAMLGHIGEYSDLKVLLIDCFEDLQSLPESIGKLTGLEELTVAYGHGNGCSMNPRLPETIGNLRWLRRLILYGAQDPRLQLHEASKRHEFPRSMSRLINITYLDLGGNGLKDIPQFVKDLPKLREIGFEYNELKEVPAFLSKLPALTTLRFAGNDLNDLPDSLGALPRLTRVTLGYNCRITQSAKNMKDVKRRFPKVRFDFVDEFDCPAH
jgi:internalin A